jgi:hypothetical protein
MTIRLPSNPAARRQKATLHIAHHSNTTSAAALASAPATLAASTRACTQNSVAASTTAAQAVARRRERERRCKLHSREIGRCAGPARWVSAQRMPHREACRNGAQIKRQSTKWKSPVGASSNSAALPGLAGAYPSMFSRDQALLCVTGQPLPHPNPLSGPEYNSKDPRLISFISL